MLLNSFSGWSNFISVSDVTCEIKHRYALCEFEFGFFSMQALITQTVIKRFYRTYNCHRARPWRPCMLYAIHVAQSHRRNTWIRPTYLFGQKHCILMLLNVLASLGISSYCISQTGTLTRLHPVKNRGNEQAHFSWHLLQFSVADSLLNLKYLCTPVIPFGVNDDCMSRPHTATK